MARPPSHELNELVRHLDRILRGQGRRFAFMGGIAVNVWAIPVPTYDIDVCVDLEEAAVPELIGVLEREGFVPPTTSWLESIGQPGFREFSVAWPFQQGLIATDIFLAGHPFQRDALRRSKPVELDEGLTTPVISPEDVLIYKLVAWRKKDQAAIERLLAIRPDLDWTYVRGWSRELGLNDRLRESLRDTGLPDTIGDLPGAE